MLKTTVSKRAFSSPGTGPTEQEKVGNLLATIPSGFTFQEGVQSNGWYKVYYSQRYMWITAINCEAIIPLPPPTTDPTPIHIQWRFEIGRNSDGTIIYGVWHEAVEITS